MEERIRISARQQALPVLLERLAGAASALGLPQPVRDDIALLVDELFTNIVAYGGLPDGETVEIRIRRGRRIVGVEILDRGVPFNPLTHPAPDLSAALAERPVGGLGTHFLRRKTRRRCYSREVGVNLLRFSVPLDAAAC